jgi:hypothetical protein
MRGVNQFLIHESELLRVFESARMPSTESAKVAPANELLSIQNDKTDAVVFRLLEKNITNRIWCLEQMLVATEELSSKLNIQSDH